MAEIIGTIGGFGSSLFFVPLASAFVDFQSVLGITAVFHVASNLSKIWLFRDAIDKKIVLWVGVPSVLLVIVGAWLTSYWDTKWMQVVLGAFMLIFSIWMWIYPDAKITPSRWNGALGGGVSGFLAGLVGTGGAVRGFVLAAFSLEKNLFVATSALIDFGVDFSRMWVYIWKGYVHKHDVLLIVGLVIVAAIGSWLGKLVLATIDQKTFRKLILGLIVAIGCWMLVSNLRLIFA